MTDRREERSDQHGTDPAETPRKGVAALTRKLLTKRGIATILGIAIAAQGLAILAYSLGGSSGGQQAGGEVSLGEFHYQHSDSHGGELERADFQVHLSLLANLDRLGRSLLVSHEFRVQQAIEELLRRAHAGDFEDPTLTELKRQLQETINQTLGRRVIAEVIITDLNLRRAHAQPQAKTTQQAAQPVLHNLPDFLPEEKPVQLEEPTTPVSVPEKSDDGKSS